jgi:aryl-alcohol dehydrogenase-like predicted oxidoreductase
MTLFPSTTQINPPPYFNKPAGDKDDMQYVRLGNTGAVVSRICLGLMSYAQLKDGESKAYDWMLTYEESEPFVKQALDAGINFFDTAEVYNDGRSEHMFGTALKKLLPQSRFTREDLVISTKILPNRSMNDRGFGGVQKGLSRKAIFAAVEGSLRRLQLDYIDLYFIHRFDPNTAIEETMKALHDLVEMGKIRYIGASSMFLWQFAQMQQVAEQRGWTKFSVVQNHLNAMYREEEREMIPYCLATGVTCMPYSPLASGVLCRQPGDQPSSRSTSDPIQKIKYFKNGDDTIAQHVLDVAKQRNVPPAQVALAWVLQKKGVAAPIIGATKPHHIEDAIKALQVKLSDDELNKIEADYQPHRIAGHA